MIPLYRDARFTFRFAEDRIVPRFHLAETLPGTPVTVFALDSAGDEPGARLAQAVCGAGGWVELAAPLIVRASGGFVVVPKVR
ncbi:MAG TPA: hypothetical protein VGE74_19975 [Gemmata sp.]